MTSTMPGLRLIPATRLWKRSVRSTYSSTLCCKPCVRVRPSQSSEARGKEIGLKLAAGRRHAMLRQILNPSKCSKLEDLSSCRKVANTTAERDMSWMRRSESLSWSTLSPSELERRLQLNRPAWLYNTYQEGRAEVSLFPETRLGAR